MGPPPSGAHIQTLICEGRPEQLGLPFALWTRTAVLQLVEREYDTKLPVRTMGLYLERWNFIAQKPTKRAYEQCPVALRRWCAGATRAILLAALLRSNGPPMAEGTEAHEGLRRPMRRTSAPAFAWQSKLRMTGRTQRLKLRESCAAELCVRWGSEGRPHRLWRGRG